MILTQTWTHPAGLKAVAGLSKPFTGVKAVQQANCVKLFR
jgi:hypothetical protein